MTIEIPAPDPHNVWRLETPGVAGWSRTSRPDDANKYFMVSSDGHLHEPADLWKERIEARYRERLPGITLDLKGNAFQKTEGFRPIRLRNIEMGGEDQLRNRAGRTPEQRIAELARIIHDPSSRGSGVCRRFAARGLEGAEGVPGGTSRGPEGAGREDAVQSGTAAEGFVNNAG